MNWESLQRSRLARIILWPLSLVYGVVVLARVRAYARGQLKPNRLRGAVVSVGNLTVGGVGKTPMVLWLAEKFLAEGKRVAILSRGYRGTDGTSDEVELFRHRLAGRVRFGIGADRFASGSALEASQPVDIFFPRRKSHSSGNANSQSRCRRRIRRSSRPPPVDYAPDTGADTSCSATWNGSGRRPRC